MAAYVFFDAVSVHPERMNGYRDKALASVKAFNGNLVANTRTSIVVRVAGGRPEL
jgi:hypothetical protein